MWRTKFSLRSGRKRPRSVDEVDDLRTQPGMGWVLVEPRMPRHVDPSFVQSRRRRNVTKRQLGTDGLGKPAGDETYRIAAGDKDGSRQLVWNDGCNMANESMHLEEVVDWPTQTASARDVDVR